jgi:spore coat polysaccharide biosynthesis protein SpsF
MLERTGIIIQARISSTRLPKKIILEIDEQITFLDILLGKLKKLKTNFPIILATSNLSVDDVLVEFASKHRIQFYRGSEENVLKRFIDCAEENNLNTIVRVCSDNPFIDLNYIQKIITNYKGEDYLSYKINNSPSILTHFGFFTEIVSLNALKKIASKKDNQCIEHVTNCIYKNPNHFNVRFLEENILNNDIRCTLDTKGDFEILKDIYFNFIKENPNAGYLEIIKYIETRDDLLVAMKKIIKENTK